MRIIFMGTPQFSVPVLDALLAAGHEIACVYCQPPRPAGRGKKDRQSPVQTRAEALQLPVRHPLSLKNDEVYDEFGSWNADVAIVVAYGLILPQRVLDAPHHGCLNIHASLLPRWRGAAPIHRAIISGDEKTGVCIMQMEVGLDTGPVLRRAEVQIGPEETTAQLHDRLSALGAEEIVAVLEDFVDLSPQPQTDVGVEYAAKIDKSEAEIDWTRPAVEIDRLIRGLSPFPGAWTTHSGERIKLLASRLATGDAAPGTVLLNPLRIACGIGAVEVKTLQRAGKAVQDAETFLNGQVFKEGDILGGTG